MGFIQKLLFFFLTILPVIDVLYKTNLGSPAIIIRALIIVLSVILLFGKMFHFNGTNCRSVYCIYFLLIYMAVVTVIIENGFFSLYAYLRVAYPLLGFLLIYYLTKYDCIDEDYFRIMIFIVIILYGITSFVNLKYRVASARGLGTADNTGYSLVTLLAGTLLFFNKKWMFITAIFFIILGSFVCGKRGAIISLAIALIPIVRFVFATYIQQISRRFLYIMAGVFICFLCVLIFGDYLDATITRFHDLDEDGGSGRDRIYLMYFDEFSRSEMIYQMFGHGLFAGLWGESHKFAFYYLLAHNDWLEILFDFGLIGVFIWGLFFWIIYKEIRQKRDDKDTLYYVLKVSFILLGIKSIFSSTFLMSINSIYMFMIMAFSIAKIESQFSQNSL